MGLICVTRMRVNNCNCDNNQVFVDEILITRDIIS